eukprot:jgi/Tetstr1/448472/TSEL_035740.t1
MLAQAAVRASRPEMRAPSAEIRVGEAEMGRRHGKMWPNDSHQRHPKVPDGVTLMGDKVPPVLNAPCRRFVALEG